MNANIDFPDLLDVWLKENKLPIARSITHPDEWYYKRFRVIVANNTGIIIPNTLHAYDPDFFDKLHVILTATIEMIDHDPKFSWSDPGYLLAE